MTRLIYTFRSQLVPLMCMHNEIENNEEADFFCELKYDIGTPTMGTSVKNLLEQVAAQVKIN